MATKDIKYLETVFTAQVDDEDTEILAKSWFVGFKTKGKGYFTLKRRLKLDERVAGKSMQSKIHREVWEKHYGPIPVGYEVDHFDYNTLNNRKENLRLLTKKENNERARKKKEKDNGQSMVEAA
jgi:hypothetical protein